MAETSSWIGTSQSPSDSSVPNKCQFCVKNELSTFVSLKSGILNSQAYLPLPLYRLLDSSPQVVFIEDTSRNSSYTTKVTYSVSCPVLKVLCLCQLNILPYIYCFFSLPCQDYFGLIFSKLWHYRNPLHFWRPCQDAILLGQLV